MLPHVVFYAIFGLCIGSFLNVCIYRIPRDESVIFPGSHCPGCGASIRFYDNIPLLSYIVLAGRCRACMNPISLRYPLVELLSGLAFLGCALTWKFAPATFLNSLFLGMVIALVFIDYDHQLLPNVITLPGAFLGFLLSPFQSELFFRDTVSWHLAKIIAFGDPFTVLPWVGSALGTAVGGGLLFGVGYTYQLTRKRQGLGLGDMKMMAMVGAFLGWRMALLTIFAGSFLGSVAGLFMILFRGGNLQAKLAFGTFLGGGAALSLFLGPHIIAWYTRTL